MMSMLNAYPATSLAEPTKNLLLEVCDTKSSIVWDNVTVCFVTGNPTEVVPDLDLLVCPVLPTLLYSYSWMRSILDKGEYIQLLHWLRQELVSCSMQPLQCGETRISESFGIRCKRLLHLVLNPCTGSERQDKQNFVIALNNCFDALHESQVESVALPVSDEGNVTDTLANFLVEFLCADATQKSKLKTVILFSPKTETLSSCRRTLSNELSATKQAKPSSKLVDLQKLRLNDTNKGEELEIKKNLGEFDISGVRENHIETMDNINEQKNQNEQTANEHKSKISKDMETKDKEPVRKEPETCPVCFDELQETNRRKLAKCEHIYCDVCFSQITRFSSLCPVCRKAFCVVRGNQPVNGQMTHSKDRSIRLPGFPNCGTIVINYHIPSGVQTEEHPHPGKPFSGASRVAYLPDNAEGNRVLLLLEKAFIARIVFTVGRSITTGMDNVVTWNDIHHKTSINGGSECYGYPDDTYLNRLTEDLAAKGITEIDL